MANELYALLPIDRKNARPLSQAALAKALNAGARKLDAQGNGRTHPPVHQQTVSNWENGVELPSDPMVDLLIEVLQEQLDGRSLLAQAKREGVLKIELKDPSEKKTSRLRRLSTDLRKFAAAPVVRGPHFESFAIGAAPPSLRGPRYESVPIGAMPPPLRSTNFESSAIGAVDTRVQKINPPAEESAKQLDAWEADLRDRLPGHLKHGVGKVMKVGAVGREYKYHFVSDGVIMRMIGFTPEDANFHLVAHQAAMRLALANYRGPTYPYPEPTVLLVFVTDENRFKVQKHMESLLQDAEGLGVHHHIAANMNQVATRIRLIEDQFQREVVEAEEFMRQEWEEGQAMFAKEMAAEQRAGDTTSPSKPDQDADPL